MLTQPTLIKAKLSNGLTIYAVKDDNITSEIIREGTYEKPLTYFLETLLPRITKPVCIDVGANIGVHTLTMAKFSSHVYAFEPVPFIHQMLQRSLAENNYDNVTLLPFALSNVNTDQIINLDTDNNCGMASIETQKNDLTYSKSNQVKVKSVIGDQFFKSYKLDKISFMKIDVEGHETNVLLGLTQLIKKHMPIISLEWSDEKTRDGFRENNFFNDLFSDYVVMPLLTNYDNFSKRVKHNPKTHPFRWILRPLHKKFIHEKIVLGKFVEHCTNYYSVMFIPKKKIPFIREVMVECSKRQL